MLMWLRLSTHPERGRRGGSGGEEGGGVEGLPLGKSVSGTLLFLSMGMS